MAEIEPVRGPWPMRPVRPGPSAPQDRPSRRKRPDAGKPEQDPAQRRRVDEYA